MNQPCVRCGRSVADLAAICHPCARGLAVALLHAAIHALTAPATVARQDRIHRPTNRHPTPPVIEPWTRERGGLVAQPLPVNLDAAEALTAVHGTLTTWARHVADERGHPLPDDQTWTMCCWLAGHTGWLRVRAEADQAFAELHNATNALRRLVDSPPARRYAGQCACSADLYGTEGRALVVCGSCGTSYDLARNRQLLHQRAEDMLLSASQIAALAVHLGITDHRVRVHNRIRKWASRGQLQVRDETDGQPLYRCGDALTKLAELVSAA